VGRKEGGYVMAFVGMDASLSGTMWRMRWEMHVNWRRLTTG